MSHGSSNAAHPKLSLIGRCFWALMGIAHAPAMVGAWKSFFLGGMDFGLLGGCLVLTASMAFFALKLYGVSFLRVRPGRRTVVAMALVVALIHVDCFRPALDAALVADYASIIVTTSLAGGLAVGAKRLGARLAGSEASSRFPFMPRRFAGASLLDSTNPCCWVLALGLFRLRAPPA